MVVVYGNKVETPLPVAISIESVQKAVVAAIWSPVTGCCVASDNYQVVSFVIDKAVDKFLLLSAGIDRPVVCAALIMTAIG